MPGEMISYYGCRCHGLLTSQLETAFRKLGQLGWAFTIVGALATVTSNSRSAISLQALRLQRVPCQCNGLSGRANRRTQCEEPRKDSKASFFFLKFSVEAVLTGA